jgi:hypothetical protein
MPIVSASSESVAITQKFANIIAQEVVPAIDHLNQQATLLTTPGNWQGNYSNRFRGEIWPSTHAALQKARESLVEVQREIERINRKIMEDGGNL